MALARYETGTSTVYDPVAEFAAVPEQQARNIILDHAETIEQFESNHAAELAQSVRTMANELPTKNGRVPISALKEMASSSDQATREAGKRVLDNAGI